MADCLGPSIDVRIAEVSLIRRAVIERFHCIIQWNPLSRTLLGRTELSFITRCLCTIQGVCFIEPHMDI